jgi:hypothetical protein
VLQYLLTLEKSKQGKAEDEWVKDFANMRVSEGPPTWLTLEHLERLLIRALMTPNNENVVPLEKEDLSCWLHPAYRENTEEGVESLVEAIDGMSFLD